MNKIRHEDVSRDSLYQDITDNLEYVYTNWDDGERQLRFLIPVLCAIRLEAFINIAGKQRVNSWDELERKLGFKQKCLVITEILGQEFDPESEPNKTAISIFEIRNALVHPKMKLQNTDEVISQEEYERRSTGCYGIKHHLRSELSVERIVKLKELTDQFVEEWGEPWLTYPEYWLRGGSTGGFTFEQNEGEQ